MSQRPFAGIRVRCSGQMRHYHRKPPPFNQSVTQPWHSSFSFSHPSFISPLLTSFVKETNYDAGWNLHESQVVEYLVDHVLTIMRCWDRKRTRKRVQRLEMKRRNVLLASDWQKQLVCLFPCQVWGKLVSKFHIICRHRHDSCLFFIMVSSVFRHLCFNIFSSIVLTEK